MQCVSRAVTAAAIGTSLALGAAGPAGAGTIVVPTDEASIQDAIDAALDGDEVIVMPGTYLETLTLRGKAITLRSNAGAAATAIDAGGKGRPLLFVQGEGPETIVDGFTLQGGIATRGAGMYCINTSPTVRNCVFDGNMAMDKGGAIYNQLGATPALIDCTFDGNAAMMPGGLGGGIYNDGAGASPSITRCAFMGNTSEGGGAMYTDGGSPSVVDCIFDGNDSLGGGGALQNNAASVSIEGSVFRNNSALVGGAILSLGQLPTITDSGFCNNSPTDIFGGFVDGGGNTFDDDCDPCFDLDGDGSVGFNDLVILLGNWGPCSGCPEDIDGDGTVGFNDLVILLGNWGPCV